MRGSKVKALRTDERPNPGRKHGGSKGADYVPDSRGRMPSRFERFMRGMVRPR